MSVATTLLSDAAVEIIGVHTDLGSEQIRANVESPQPADTVEGFWVPMIGWVLSPAGDPVEVRVSDRWEELHGFPPNMTRPDIATAFPDSARAGRSGFSVAFSVTRLPLEFDLWLSALVRDESIRFALIRGRRRPFRQAPLPAVIPLTVTTLGRTGSTLLMTLLSRHPAIAAVRPTAYDGRPFAYWLGVATRLSTPGSRSRLINSTGADDDWWLGPDTLDVASLVSTGAPIENTLLRDAPDQLLADALLRAGEFAREIAFAEGKTGVRYAAEKAVPSFVPRVLGEICEDAKELVLVRDLRDVFASMISFNAKRGYASFGREDVGTDADFVQRFSTDADRLAAAWAERRDRAHLVRYEELNADPERCLEQIFTYLELECSGPLLRSIIDEANEMLNEIVGDHRTSSEASSTGRWRTDLDPDLRDACDAAVERAMQEFGYA